MGEAIQFLLFGRRMPETCNAAFSAFLGSQSLRGYRRSAGFRHDAWAKRSEIGALVAGVAY